MFTHKHISCILLLSFIFLSQVAAAQATRTYRKTTHTLQRQGDGITICQPGELNDQNQLLEREIITISLPARETARFINGQTSIAVDPNFMTGSASSYTFGGATSAGATVTLTMTLAVNGINVFTGGASCNASGINTCGVNFVPGPLNLNRCDRRIRNNLNSTQPLVLTLTAQTQVNSFCTAIESTEPGPFEGAGTSTAGGQGEYFAGRTKATVTELTQIARDCPGNCEIFDNLDGTFYQVCDQEPCEEQFPVEDFFDGIRSGREYCRCPVEPVNALGEDFLFTDYASCQENYCGSASDVISLTNPLGSNLEEVYCGCLHLPDDPVAYDFCLEQFPDLPPPEPEDEEDEDEEELSCEEATEQFASGSIDLTEYCTTCEPDDVSTCMQNIACEYARESYENGSNNWANVCFTCHVANDAAYEACMADQCSDEPVLAIENPTYAEVRAFNESSALRDYCHCTSQASNQFESAAVTLVESCIIGLQQPLPCRTDISSASDCDCREDAEYPDFDHEACVEETCGTLDDVFAEQTPDNYLEVVEDYCGCVSDGGIETDGCFEDLIDMIENAAE